MFPLIFCALCAWQFPQSFVFEIQSAFHVRNKVKTKKKGLHPKSSDICIPKKYCLTYYCNFMLNNNMAEQEYVCA